MRRAGTYVRSVMAGATLMLAAGASHATPVALNFDGVASGSTADSAASGLGIHFALASFLPLLDGSGDPIPGSEAYRPDPNAIDEARVGDPNVRGYGNAPSPGNALDAIDQGIVILFDAPVTLASFAVTLDQSAFGFPGAFDIVFQGDAGAALQSLPTSQNVPGFTASFAGTLANVASIYLPSGAYYDDLRFEVVPEPATALLMALGLGGLASIRRKPKS